MEDKIEENLEIEQDVDTQEEETTEDAQKGKPKRTDEEEYDHLQGRLKRLAKKLGKEEQPKEPEQPAPKTGDLDLGQLAYLRATLGIKGQAEIGLVKEYVRAGKDILDLENNRHFMNDLKDLRDAAETKSATPSNTRRAGGGSGNDFAIALAEYEQTGKLPDDFELRSKVIDARMSRDGDTIPPWRRQ